MLVTLAGLIEPGEPLGDPLFLAADGFWIIAALDADAQRVLEPRPLLEEMGAAAVDLGIFPVPENIAGFGIQKHDALRQDVDRLGQPVMGLSRFGDGGFRFGARAHDLVRDTDRSAPVAANELWARAAGPPWAAHDRHTLSLLLLDWPETRHWAIHTQLQLTMLSANSLNKRYLGPVATVHPDSADHPTFGSCT